MKELQTEIAVIGGGASGLTAASAAAENGAQVLLLEKLPRVGKKILLTGNGRCNLGNRNCEVQNWHGSVQQRAEILSAFGDASDYFAQRGLFCRTDAEGRIYPLSNTAASVLDTLRFACQARDVQIRCESPVKKIIREKSGFLLELPDCTVSARKVIFAVGGAAAPNCGTDGSSFELIRAWHQPTTLVPALAPIRTEAKFVSALKGMRLPARVSLITGQDVTASSQGEVQFADSALSGICVFDLARYVQNGPWQMLRLRLLPEWTDAQVHQSIHQLLKMRAALPTEDLLTGLIPKRVGQVLLKSCGISPSMITERISREQRHLIIDRFLAWDFPVSGTASFSSAQVTAGGIRGEEIDENLMSRRCEGLYFAGECLDVDGCCGGFNLQWAWASGVHTGCAAAAALCNMGE